MLHPNFGSGCSILKSQLKIELKANLFSDSQSHVPYSLWTKSPLWSFGSNQVDLGGI